MSRCLEAPLRSPIPLLRLLVLLPPRGSKRDSSKETEVRRPLVRDRVPCRSKTGRDAT